ncbi:MAG: DUF4388 domain-containing protein, partial [bacterium]|nr:DUF4388 domain-containing protein [bacterium]
MAIVADIEDLAAAEFLLMLSANQKSGKLTGISDDNKLMVAFRQGSIVYAGSTAVRERVGSILVGRGLITEEQLQEAITRQKSGSGVNHLGNILVDMGVITQAALAEVVRSQFQKVIIELLSWKDGILTFNSMSIPDLGAVHVDPREILVDVGFETEMLVLGSMSTLEDDQLSNVVSAGTTAIFGDPSTEPQTPDRPPAEADDAHSMMQSMMQEMQNLSLVSINAEASLEVLTTALLVVRRAMLLIVYPSHLGGVGGFGFQQGSLSSEEVVRNFIILRKHESIFSRVVKSKTSYQGPAGETAYDLHIMQQMGGECPPEVIVL